LNKINLQNVQFLMPNNFRKYLPKQEQFKDVQALLYKLKDFKDLNFCFQIQRLSRIFKFCKNPWLSQGVSQSAGLIWQVPYEIFSVYLHDIKPHWFSYKWYITKNVLVSKLDSDQVGNILTRIFKSIFNIPVQITVWQSGHVTSVRISCS
jgi:hypothetical protein